MLSHQPARGNIASYDRLRQVRRLSLHGLPYHHPHLPGKISNVIGRRTRAHLSRISTIVTDFSRGAKVSRPVHYIDHGNLDDRLFIVHFPHFT